MKILIVPLVFLVVLTALALGDPQHNDLQHEVEGSDLQSNVELRVKRKAAEPKSGGQKSRSMKPTEPKQTIKKPGQIAVGSASNSSNVINGTETTGNNTSGGNATSASASSKPGMRNGNKQGQRVGNGQMRGQGGGNGLMRGGNGPMRGGLKGNGTSGNNTAKAGGARNGLKNMFANLGGGGGGAKNKPNMANGGKKAGGAGGGKQSPLAQLGFGKQQGAGQNGQRKGPGPKLPGGAKNAISTGNNTVQPSKNGTTEAPVKSTSAQPLPVVNNKMAIKPAIDDDNDKAPVAKPAVLVQILPVNTSSPVTTVTPAPAANISDTVAVISTPELKPSTESTVPARASDMLPAINASSPAVIMPLDLVVPLPVVPLPAVPLPAVPLSAVPLPAAAPVPAVAENDNAPKPIPARK